MFNNISTTHKKEVSWLDKIDRRFQWIKKCLMELEDRLGHVFPQNWNVSERMAVQFCELTSRMVSDLLSQRSGQFEIIDFKFKIIELNF